jgi:hypothetical protein
MKKLALSFLAISTLASTAATVSVSRSGQGIIPVTTTGTVLSTGGYYIGVGTFSMIPEVRDPASLAAAVSAFSEFARSTAPTSGGTAGTITGSFSSFGGATPATFNSREIFVVVGNQSTRETSTEFAILRGTPAWTFAGDVTAADSTAVVIQSVNSFDTLSGAGTEVDPGATGQDRVALALAVVVPEPSSIVLLAMGALGLIRRRR